MFFVRRVFVCLMVALALILASSVEAQPSRYMLSYEIHVKPGAVDEWEAGMKKVIITVKHHDGYCTWQTR